MHKIDREEIENSLIDSRNSDLWKYLLERYIIDVYHSEYGNSQIKSIGDDYLIILNDKEIINEVFTHELLHLYVIDKYFNISTYLSKLRERYQFLFLFIQKEDIYYIHNILSHLIMLPIYIKLGYKSDTFLPSLDIEHIKNNIEPIRNITLSCAKFEDSSTADFIRYAIMMLSESWHYDYSEHLDILKEKDADLFKITEDLVVNWKDTDNTEELKLLLDKFMESLNDWIIKKRQS